MSPNSICAGILTGALGAAVTPAVAAEDLPTVLAACRAEVDSARRLDCYDREADKLVAATPSRAAAPLAAAQTSQERFGYRGELAREEHDREKQETRGLEELVATVTAISTRPDGTLVMTLDNGQVWRQNRPDPFFRIKIGEQARIEPAALGSFMLSGPAKRSTRVTRVR